jgi:hypothetical protein
LKEFRNSCIVEETGVTRFHGFEMKSVSGRGNHTPFSTSSVSAAEKLSPCLQSRLQDARSDVTAATMVADFNQWPLESEGFRGMTIKILINWNC